MDQELKRVHQEDGSFIVQRVKNGELQALKETQTDSGEIISVNNEMLTIQTIVITRRICEKITF